jgi:hypothetical protein
MSIHSLGQLSICADSLYFACERAEQPGVAALGQQLAELFIIQFEDALGLQ